MLKRVLLLLHLLALAVAPLAADETAPKPVAPLIKDVTVEEAGKLLKENPKVVVLDVRTPEEFAKGHIPGAKNVDFLGDIFSQQTATLDPKTPILVHCGSGGRSTQALDLLKDKQIVYHLKDGFKAWEKAGQPVEK